MKTQSLSKLPDRERAREREPQLKVWLILIPDTSGARTQSLIHTHMQLRAARSLWTNFFWAKYSIPLATWSPKPIRSFTVGFCEGTKTCDEAAETREQLTSGFHVLWRNVPFSQSGWSVAHPHASYTGEPLEGALPWAALCPAETECSGDGSFSWWCPRGGTGPPPPNLLFLLIRR